MSSKVCSRNFSACWESLSCWDCHLQDGDPGGIETGTSFAYYIVLSIFLLFNKASPQNGIAIFYGRLGDVLSGHLGACLLLLSGFFTSCIPTLTGYNPHWYISPLLHLSMIISDLCLIWQVRGQVDFFRSFSRGFPWGATRLLALDLEDLLEPKKRMLSMPSMSRLMRMMTMNRIMKSCSLWMWVCRPAFNAVTID